MYSEVFILFVFQIHRSTLPARITKHRCLYLRTGRKKCFHVRQVGILFCKCVLRQISTKHTSRTSSIRQIYELVKHVNIV